VKIYTKTGDSGDTGLLGGGRVGKDDLRVRAYGEVDELNAVLGVVLSHDPEARLSALLSRIQRDLFAIGAQLSDARGKVASRQPKSRLTASHVARLEKAIDLHDAAMPPLTTFLLPGGAPVGAWLHLARTVCRRAERDVVALARREPVDARVIVYLNRLSDLLFVLARHANMQAGRAEEPW
jgi:cob(I)alamin adenosyltransferase